MDTTLYTIENLARAANVGIETIRYYQKKNLLPAINTVDTAEAVYPVEIMDRLRFISRGIQLGFTVDEIQQFLQLADGTNRPVTMRRCARYSTKECPSSTSPGSCASGPVQVRTH